MKLQKVPGSNPTKGIVGFFGRDVRQLLLMGQDRPSEALVCCVVGWSLEGSAVTVLQPTPANRKCIQYMPGNWWCSMTEACVLCCVLGPPMHLRLGVWLQRGLYCCSKAVTLEKCTEEDQLLNATTHDMTCTLCDTLRDAPILEALLL